MEGWPDPPFLRAEGPEFVEQINRTNEVVDRLEAAGWNFEAAPEIFARQSAACDVAAKEIVSFFDGEEPDALGPLEEAPQGGAHQPGCQCHLSVGPTEFRSRGTLDPSMRVARFCERVGDYRAEVSRVTDVAEAVAAAARDAVANPMPPAVRRAG